MAQEPAGRDELYQMLAHRGARLLWTVGTSRGPMHRCEIQDSEKGCVVCTRRQIALRLRSLGDLPTRIYALFIHATDHVAACIFVPATRRQSRKVSEYHALEREGSERETWLSQTISSQCVSVIVADVHWL